MKKTTMRKVVCLLMVAMLALSLSVAVFARATKCSSCGSSDLNWEVTSKTKKHETCKYAGEHYKFTTVEKLICGECGKSNGSQTTYTYDCGYNH